MPCVPITLSFTHTSKTRLPTSEPQYVHRNVSGTPGVGLGLSLVAAVAKLHGGVLDLADNHPGLRATLQMSPNGIRP